MFTQGGQQLTFSSLGATNSAHTPMQYWCLFNDLGFAPPVATLTHMLVPTGLYEPCPTGSDANEDNAVGCALTLAVGLVDARNRSTSNGATDQAKPHRHALT